MPQKMVQPRRRTGVFVERYQELHLAAVVKGASRSEVSEKRDYCSIVRQGICGKCAYSLFARSLRQRFEQPGPHSASLPVVGDSHCRFGHLVGGLDKARDSYSVASVEVERNQSLVIVVVDLGEICELILAQMIDGTEETQIARLRSQALEALGKRVAITRPDRADFDSSAVGQIDGISHSWKLAVPASYRSPGWRLVAAPGPRTMKPRASPDVDFRI
jgi:hypothetical protein